MLQEIRGGLLQDPVGEGAGDFDVAAFHAAEGAVGGDLHIHLRVAHCDGGCEVDFFRGGDEVGRRRGVGLAALLLALENGLPARLRAHEGDFIIKLMPEQAEPVTQQAEHDQLEKACGGILGADLLEISVAEALPAFGGHGWGLPGVGRETGISGVVGKRRGVAGPGVEDRIAADAVVRINPIEDEAGFELQLVQNGEIAVDVEFIGDGPAAHGGGHLLVIDRFLEGDDPVHEALGVEIVLGGGG